MISKKISLAGYSIRAYGAVVCLTLAISAARAQDTEWNVASGDWSVGGNWTDGQPTENFTATVQNQGTTTVSQAGEICSTLSCYNGGIHIVSGDIEVTNTMSLGASGGTGTCIQDGGSNRVSGGQLLLGINPGSKGYYYMNDGYLSVAEGRPYGWLIPGRYGFGQFVQNGGTVSVHSIRMCIYIAAEGIYDLNNGLLRVNTDILAGMHANGTINQSGGLIDIIGSTANAFNIPYPTADKPHQATYNFLGGELRMTNGAHIRLYDNGIFNFGDTNGTGIMTGGIGNLEVGRNRNANVPVSRLRGWGTITSTGTLENNAEVIADGYGTDRTLDLSRLNPAIQNPYENTTNNGWFARNRGKLLLPPITVAPGDNTYAWGEDAADTVNDLVNSIQMVFTNVTVGGTMTNALMATDRSNLPTLPQKVPIMAVWQLTKSPALAFDTVTLNIRYDDYARKESGIAANNMTVWRSTGGDWSIFPTSVDTNSMIATTTFTSLATTEFVAVGLYAPQGTVFTFQ